MTGRTRSAYRQSPEPSPSEWGVVGHYNRWSGFHRTTDPYAYLGLLRLALTHLRSPRTVRYVLHLLRDRWRHRRCNTTDFHHFGCTLDPFGKRMNDEYLWKQAWTGSASSPTPQEDS